MKNVLHVTEFVFPSRLRILCEKLDAEKLPTDIEEAQLILKK